MSTPPVVQYASRTDVGMRRAVNQDACDVRLCRDHAEWSHHGHLFVVADGIGGHAVGDLASRICVDTLPIAFFKHSGNSVAELLEHAISAANRAINNRGRENREFEGMGTTCTALSLSAVGAVVGHVGDSRLYRVRRGLIQQLTFDHSLQWEMIRLGRATPENVEDFHPRNVITRCLGPDSSVQVDIEGPFPVEAGDIYMLCSDGITNHLSDAEIGLVLSNLPPADSSRLLINLANLRGGHDNSTVIVVNVDSYPVTTPITTPAASTPTPPTPGDRPKHSRSPARNLAALAILALSALLSAAAVRWIVAASPPGPAGFLAASAAGALLLFCGLLAALRTRRPTTASADLDPLPAPDTPGHTPAAAETPPPADSSQKLHRSLFNPSAPYRTVDCTDAEELFNFLAEAHSELIQASRDNAWNVDLNELEQLDRQATAAAQSGKPDRVLRARNRAIDLVMRELPQRQSVKG